MRFQVKADMLVIVFSILITLLVVRLITNKTYRVTASYYRCTKGQLIQLEKELILCQKGDLRSMTCYSDIKKTVCTKIKAVK